MGRFAVLTGAGRLSGAVVLVDTESHMLYLTMLNRRDSFLPCLPSVSACRSIGTHLATILRLLTFVRDTVHQTE
jgi:hypothetical protein